MVSVVYIFFFKASNWHETLYRIQLAYNIGKRIDIQNFKTQKFIISDQPNAAKFREFWGERSELRRFQDGVVREVVVWGNRKDEVGRRSVLLVFIS